MRVNASAARSWIGRISKAGLSDKFFNLPAFRLRICFEFLAKEHRGTYKIRPFDFDPDLLTASLLPIIFRT